jgi:hypothetical protein
MCANRTRRATRLEPLMVRPRLIGAGAARHRRAARLLLRCFEPSIQALGEYGPAVDGSLNNLAGRRMGVVVPGIVPFVAGTVIPIPSDNSRHGLARAPQVAIRSDGGPARKVHAAPLARTRQAFGDTALPRPTTRLLPQASLSATAPGPECIRLTVRRKETLSARSAAHRCPLGTAGTQFSTWLPALLRRVTRGRISPGSEHRT